MKKYFLKSNNQELKLGDRIELDFTKDMEDGTHYHHLECKLMEELVPLLLASDIIRMEDDSKDMAELMTQSAIGELLVKDLEKRMKDAEREMQEMKHDMQHLRNTVLVQKNRIRALEKAVK